MADQSFLYGLSGRWPLISKEVYRLEISDVPIYRAICKVCNENGLRKPSWNDDVIDSGNRIEAELQAKLAPG